MRFLGCVNGIDKFENDNDLDIYLDRILINLDNAINEIEKNNLDSNSSKLKDIKKEIKELKK